MRDKKVIIFGKNDCAKCKTTKNKIDHYISKWGLADHVPVVFFNVDTIDGLSESAFRDVAKIPTTIVEQREVTLARWDGEVPHSETLRASLQT